MPPPEAAAQEEVTATMSPSSSSENKMKHDEDKQQPLTLGEPTSTATNSYDEDPVPVASVTIPSARFAHGAKSHKISQALTLGKQRLQADRRSYGGYLALVSLCMILYPLHYLSVYAGVVRDNNSSQVLPALLLAASIVQMIVGVAGLILGMKYYVWDPDSDVKPSSYSSIQIFSKASQVAHLTWIFETAYLIYVAVDMVQNEERRGGKVNNIFATSMNDATLQEDAPYDHILRFPPDYDANSRDVQIVAAMGTLGIVAYGMAFISNVWVSSSSLARLEGVDGVCAITTASDANSNENGSHTQTSYFTTPSRREAHEQKIPPRTVNYFAEVFLWSTLLFILAGVSQLILGAYTLVQIANRDLSSTLLSGSLYVFYQPLVPVILGGFQVVMGYFGVARYWRHHDAQTWTCGLLQENSYQYLLLLQWIAMTVVPALVALGSSPDEISQDGAASVMFRTALGTMGLYLLPAISDYAMRTLPTRASRGYYYSTRTAAFARRNSVESSNEHKDRNVIFEDEHVFMSSNNDIIFEDPEMPSLEDHQGDDDDTSYDDSRIGQPGLDSFLTESSESPEKIPYYGTHPNAKPATETGLTDDGVRSVMDYISTSTDDTDSRRGWEDTTDESYNSEMHSEEEPTFDRSFYDGTIKEIFGDGPPQAPRRKISPDKIHRTPPKSPRSPKSPKIPLSMPLVAAVVDEDGSSSSTSPQKKERRSSRSKSGSRRRSSSSRKSSSRERRRAKLWPQHSESSESINSLESPPSKKPRRRRETSKSPPLPNRKPHKKKKKTKITTKPTKPSSLSSLNGRVLETIPDLSDESAIQESSSVSDAANERDIDDELDEVDEAWLQQYDVAPSTLAVASPDTSTSYSTTDTAELQSRIDDIEAELIAASPRNVVFP